MKARFRRKGSAEKNSASLAPDGARFLTSHLDPPSPEDQSWPAPPPPLIPLSAIGADPPFHSSTVPQWPVPAPPSVVDPAVAVAPPGPRPRPRHIPIDTSKYRLTQWTVHDYALDAARKSPGSTRLPRHVPIIIPDFAQPFSHNLLAAPPGSDLQHLQRLPAPPAPRRTAPLGDPESIDCADAARARPRPRHLQRHRRHRRHDTAQRVLDEAGPVMNDSQVSLVASEASSEAPAAPAQPLNGAAGNAGIGPGGAAPQGNSPTNLSGLVCNVHRTTGDEPHGLVGATTTVLGDKLYVFGGRIHSRHKPQLTADLYELDLVRRHWTKIDAGGDIPPPRYFHSVCALGDSKLVCYGGMSPSTGPKNAAPTAKGEPQPEVVVMSDIHLYDVPTRKWVKVAPANDPQPRYAHCATVLPSSAVFTSANAPQSAIHHNPPSADPHSGTLGVHLDGTGGAEMVVVGGQDSNNNYLEQISVFNLRSLQWTSTTPLSRKCGAYKSMVAPMVGSAADLVFQGAPLNDAPGPPAAKARSGTPMLIYSNYNFLDVKLDLQIRLPDGTLIEKPMAGSVSPPGLRFPNGGIIDGHFVVSGTFLTSSKHEYALWALDLKTLTWARIDTNGSIFSQGSWNRGVLWHRRNTFLILGHRKRSLVDDYNHRRINFSHVCMVELEAFGLYDNPRKHGPTSPYLSVSAPAVPVSLQHGLPSYGGGGRPFSGAAEQLGQLALGLTEFSDMEIVALGGEKIPCNSLLLSRRWGPFFNQLLVESASTQETASVSDAATLRPLARSQASRNSSVTITPSVANGLTPAGPGPGAENILDPQRSLSRSTSRTLVEHPTISSVQASSRPRALYLPHMAPTIHLLLHFLYTSTLPPVGSPLCTPHTLCSLLQMARPYQVDGLLEATVERLHEVLDGRNSAAVFNAAAMAAGGGHGLHGAFRSIMSPSTRRESETSGPGDQHLAGKTAGLSLGSMLDESPRKRGHGKTNSVGSASTDTSASRSTDWSHTDTEASAQEDNTDRTVRKGERERDRERDGDSREQWTGDVSSVIGLQKRGLRGLMEGRRLRERANTGGAD